MYQIAHHINGISLNPLEYALSPEGKLLEFPTKEKAKEFLLTKISQKELQEDLDSSILIVHPITPKEKEGWECKGCGAEWASTVADNEIPNNCPYC